MPQLMLCYSSAIARELASAGRLLSLSLRERERDWKTELEESYPSHGRRIVR